MKNLLVILQQIINMFRRNPNPTSEGTKGYAGLWRWVDQQSCQGWYPNIKECRKYNEKEIISITFNNIIHPLFSASKIIEKKTNIDVCRDPDDDKFIECAVDSKALYIVSGDKDLLDISEYEGIQITAKEFCDRYEI